MESLTSLCTTTIDDNRAQLASTAIFPLYELEPDDESSKRKIGYDESVIRQLTDQFKRDISDVITNDYYEDGVVSHTERFVETIINENNASVVKNAMMELYIQNFDNPDMLIGLLIMMGTLDYSVASPQGPIMATGLLSHKNDYVKDRAIRTFERWNSKDGLVVLKNVECSAPWMQKYVDKVIMYLERDGY